MLVINACLGFHEEYKAKKSLDELSHQLESEVAVRRNGKTVQLNVKELVPGDVVLLVGGTIVPADTQWIKGDTVSVDTAPLTGEPIPRKYPGEHGDVILSGTTVVAGECYGRVFRTGEHTEIGNAQKEIMADKTVSVVSVFQKKIMLVVQILVSASFALVIAVLLVQGLYYDGFQANVSQTILDAVSSLSMHACPQVLVACCVLLRQYYLISPLIYFAFINLDYNIVVGHLDSFNPNCSSTCTSSEHGTRS